MYIGLEADFCGGCPGGAEDVCVADFLLGRGGGAEVPPDLSESL